MSRIMTSLIFGIFYYFYYLGVLGGAWEAARRSGIVLPKEIEMILYGISFLLFLVASYRTKLAAESYDNCNYEFWSTHKMAGIMLKTNLAYLPIIGQFIGSKKE